MVSSANASSLGRINWKYLERITHPSIWGLSKKNHGGSSDEAVDVVVVNNSNLPGCSRGW